MKRRVSLVAMTGFLFVPIILGIVFGFGFGIIGGIVSWVITFYFITFGGMGKYSTLSVLTLISSLVFSVIFFHNSSQTYLFCLIFAPWLFWIFIRRSLYHTEKRLARNYDSREDYARISDKRCVICKKHPVSKKYHIHHVHKIESKDIRSYFENCRCENCMTILSNSSG